MAILNITYQGRSADVVATLDDRASDLDVRRIAVEVVRAGELPGVSAPDLPADAFRHFVVDRLTGPDGQLRIYLRPKVPFGEACEPNRRRCGAPGFRDRGAAKPADR